MTSFIEVNYLREIKMFYFAVHKRKMKKWKLNFDFEQEYYLFKFEKSTIHVVMKLE